MVITWKTRKIQTLFPVKKKTLFPLCKIYYGICHCGENYTGKTERDSKTRWSEHNSPEHNLVLARHILKNIGHIVTWTILVPASKKRSIRKNYLLRLFIAQLKPSLNKQKEFDCLILFKNGIT